MSSNHRDGADYNEQPPIMIGDQIAFQGRRYVQFETVMALQKEIQRLGAENEAYMSTDYWFERHKDVKAQLTDAQEWLEAKDDQIEHLVDFGDRMEEQRDALVLALVKIAGKPEQAKTIAEKALSIQARAQKRE